MLQQVMTNPVKIIFREVPVPEPEDHQVLVKIMNIGICGSDIHVYHENIPLPPTLSHRATRCPEKLLKWGKTLLSSTKDKK